MESLFDLARWSFLITATSIVAIVTFIIVFFIMLSKHPLNKEEFVQEYMKDES